MADEKPSNEAIGAMFLNEDPDTPEVVEEDVEEEFVVEATPEGDDEQPELESTEDESADDAEPEFVEIEYEGQLYEVPTSLKDALLRQSDYTTKTQEVAAQRKEVEVLHGQLQQQRQQFEFAESIQADVLKAQQLEQTANQYHEYLRSNIDNLSSTDIEKLRLAIEDSRRERDQIVQSVYGKTQEFQQAQEQSIMELLNKGTEVLRSKIPQWGESHQKQVRDYGLSLGFTEQELSHVLDPRQVEVLWKASQYDNLQKGKTAAVKVAQEAPTIKPKSRDPMPKDVRQKLDLKNKLKSKNISTRDKQNLVAQDIGSRW